MGLKWTESRDRTVTEYGPILALFVSQGCYTEGTNPERESQS